MKEWGFWEWLTYSCIAVAAIVSALDVALKNTSSGNFAMKSVAERKTWALAPLVLLLISFVLIVLLREGLIGREFAQFPQHYEAEIVSKREFRNEKVLLDGKKYKECKFYNVTFVYNGTTAIQFDHNEIMGGFYLSSESPAVNGTFFLVKAFALLKSDVPLLGLGPSNDLEEMRKTGPQADPPKAPAPLDKPKER